VHMIKLTMQRDITPYAASGGRAVGTVNCGA